MDIKSRLHRPPQRDYLKPEPVDGNQDTSTNQMTLVARCAFGLEAIVARELQGLGYKTCTTGPGQVEYTGSWESICQTNLWLRCADRISILIAEFSCRDFDTHFPAVQQGSRLRGSLALGGFSNVPVF